MTLCRWKWTQTLHLSTNLQVCCGCPPPSDITPNLSYSCRCSPPPLPLPPPPPPSLCCCWPLPSPLKPTLSISRMSKSLTKSLVKWEKRNGKKMLKKELWDVNSHFHSMNSIKDIHSSNVHFSVYPLKNFTTNFKNLKKNVNGLRPQVDFNNLAVSQHKKSYPCSSHTK